MSLVAQVLHHAKRFGILVNIKRNAVAGEIYLLKPFGDSHHRDRAPESYLVKSLHCGAQLPLSAVDNYELRQVLALLHKTRVTPSEHLFHRGEIIRTLHSLDVEMAVILLRRLGILEHHA